MGADSKGKKSTETGEEALENRQPARSLAIANKGVQSGEDFAKLMSNVMSDLIEGRITPSVGNAVCNAGGKLLRIVELQMKYGTPNGNSKPRRVLTLVAEETDGEC